MGKLETSGIRPIVIKEITEFAKEYGLKKSYCLVQGQGAIMSGPSDIDLAVRSGRIDEFTIAVKEETSTLLDFECLTWNSRAGKVKRFDSERGSIDL